MLTKHIIEGVRGGDAAGSDGLIRMDDLYSYVRRHVMQDSAQEPMKWELNIRGQELIIARGRVVQPPPPPIRPSATVGGQLLHFRITKKPAHGRTGTIYKAIDTTLGRSVALKVLDPELTAREINLRRFQREAQLASNLSHPNACVIHGLFETGGLHFIVMEYVDGKTVRQLVNGRPLYLESSLSVALQVCDALSAAHAKGIIHRNINATNVMVTPDGQAKILGFGLATLLDDNPHAEHLEELGVPYGTATYAAPEQAVGKKVDHRADIFSTGVLLYEMLAGIWPFKGQTTVEVRYAVLHDTPEPIEEVRKDDPPPSIQVILDRALAKRPADRYQRIAEMRDALRVAMREMATARDHLHPQTGGVPTEIVHVPVRPRHEPTTGGGVVDSLRRWWRDRTMGMNIHATLPPLSLRSGSAATTPGTSTSPPSAQQVSQFKLEKSIAILPFRNLSNDPEIRFYEFSLADAVITELARNRSLAVRPSSVVAKYQGRDVDPREVGKELNVSAVISASFLRTGGVLRVSAQLIDVVTGEILWNDRIDATADDIIALQDTIACHIAQRLNV